MTREELANVLTECLSFIAEDDAPESPNSSMVVMTEWNLSSEDGVELACDLSERLSMEIPHTDNPLIEQDPISGKCRARSFNEVVDYLEHLTVSIGSQ